ncbi:MAG: cbb3-type cytochrome c oxidase subunit I [Rhodocyclaceae bacterium]|nr:cbb3-type cytochrome c oxidase subunit I [Rhodocyclaceae bacterium]
MLLATLAVAGAAFFAILIVLARVPAIGALFPGPRFYKVALTLHVNLAQLVWFTSVAGALWSLAGPDGGRHLERAALWCCAAGAATIAVSPALGALSPVTSNYLPVLDHPVFASGVTLFGAGLGLQAWRGWAAWRQGRGPSPLADGLGMAAGTALATLALLAASAVELRQAPAGPGFYEALFWGAGHAWQFTLALLMMTAWLWLAAGARHPFTDPRRARLLLAAGTLPLAAAPVLQALHPVMSGAYRSGFTDLMRYGLWPAPALLCAVLLAATAGRVNAGWRRTALRLSALLFAAGLALGAAIGGANTVVTAHYHGTIGAVTLALMGLSHGLLPVLGRPVPPAGLVCRQLRLYGFGILLMMAGLAVAGFAGAPRKLPGNVGLDLGPEFFARLVMGLGGTLATAGILMFVALMLRQAGPVARRPAPAWPLEGRA